MAGVIWANQTDAWTFREFSVLDRFNRRTWTTVTRRCRCLVFMTAFSMRFPLARPWIRDLQGVGKSGTRDKCLWNLK